MMTTVYKRNSLCINNNSFSDMPSLLTFLNKNAITGLSLSTSEDYLKKAFPKWDRYFLAEHILNQTPSPTQHYLAPRTDGLALGHYGFNPLPYQHWYHIDEMVQSELLLKELVFIEALKYSNFYVNAVPCFSCYYLEEPLKDKDTIIKHELPLNEWQKYQNDLSHNQLQVFFQQDVKHPSKYYCAHSSGGLRKNVSTFLKDNTDFLSSHGLHKIGKRYVIPVFETYHLYLLYLYWKGKLPYEAIINANNSLIERLIDAKLPDKILYTTMIYKNNSIFYINRIKNIERYYQLFTDKCYLEKLHKFFSGVNSDLIRKLLFSPELVKNSLMGDWPDYHIFIKHMLDYIIIDDQANGEEIFKKLYELTEFISTPLHIYLDKLFVSLLRQDIQKWGNNFDIIESKIFAELMNNPYFKEYYLTPISTNLLNLEMMEIFPFNSLWSLIFSCAT